MGHGENFSILNETNNSEALNGMKERLSLPEVSTHEFVAKFHNKLPDLAFQCTMSEYGKSLESTIQFIASGSDSNGKPFEITSNGGLKIWPDGMFAASGIIMTDHNGTFRSLDRTDRADVLAALARGIDESKEMTYLEKRTQIMRSNGGSLFFSMNMENPYSKQIMEIAKTIAHDRVSVRNFTDITRAVPGIHLEQKDPHTVIFDTVGNKPYIASLSVNGEKQTVDA